MRRIRLGCRLSYASLTPTAAVFLVQPPAHARHMLERDELRFVGTSTPIEHVDSFGNRCQRVTLSPGDSEVRYEALAAVPDSGDAVEPDARQVPPQELPSSLLRFTLPSRYAETDKLLGFAWETFAHVPRGWSRARAICDWVHDNVRYKRGVSSPHWSATDVIAHRQGVCRDRAHAVIALCRAFNMPARYAVSYLPDIDVLDDGNPMDFHAYAEVWLEGGWQVFDPHELSPRKGRVFLASGLDAADAAFATLYGGARLSGFEVWADSLEESAKAAPAAPFVRSPDPPLSDAPALALV
jgi:transglutaminase-like putative cysteine protease